MEPHARPMASRFIYGLFFSVSVAALLLVGFSAFSGESTDVAGGEKPEAVAPLTSGQSAVETATFALG